MIDVGTPCPLCEAPLAAKRLRDMEGDEAPMRLTLRHLPVLSCEAPHRYFVAHDFPIRLLNALVDREIGKIPAGSEKGLLWKKYLCGGCGAPLPAAGGDTRTFTTSLAWPDAPGFAVDVRMPVFRCASCGREQVRSGAELAKLLPAALVHAFKAAGMKAPG